MLDASAISAGSPFEAAIRKMIRESDAVMSVVGSDYVSPWVLEEMKMAKAEEKPVITMLSGDVSRPSGLPADVQSVQIGNSAVAMESNLAAFVGKLST